MAPRVREQGEKEGGVEEEAIVGNRGVVIVFNK